MTCPSLTRAILTAARALCDDERLCAHIGITDASYSLAGNDWQRQRDEALRVYAVAAGVDLDRLPVSVHERWDDSSPEQRAAVWEKAVGMVGR